MKRWLFTILAAVSLLLLLTTATFWVMGYWYFDLLEWQIGGEHVTLTSNPRQTSPGHVQVMWQTGPPPVRATGELWPHLDFFHYWKGFSFSRDRSIPLLGSHHVRAGPGFVVTAPVSTIEGYVLEVPDWFLVLLFLPLPVIWAWKRWLASRQKKVGLCPVCSYDLRAHKPGEKCPECGAVIPQEANT